MELVELCHCQYAAENIKEESFVCFPGSEEYVTFRAQLNSTADVESSTLLSLIKGWVSTGPTIHVSGVLRRVDKDCPVAISDFSEGECVISPTESQAAQSDNIAAIVGGVVVIVVVIAVTTAVSVVIALVMRHYHCHGDSRKKTEE